MIAFREWTDYDKLVKYIKTNGNLATTCKRGPNKYVRNIIFNPYKDPEVKTDAWINEIKHFIGEYPELPNKFWWHNDDDLLDEYRYLYRSYNVVIANLRRDSRHTLLTNPNTCVSSLYFYKENNHIHLIVWQRSADVSLGLRYDYLQAKWLLNDAATKLNAKVGSLTYIVLNAHIYLNNMDITDKDSYFKN